MHAARCTMARWRPPAVAVRNRVAVRAAHHRQALGYLRIAGTGFKLEDQLAQLILWLTSHRIAPSHCIMCVITRHGPWHNHADITDSTDWPAVPTAVQTCTCTCTCIHMHLARYLIDRLLPLEFHLGRQVPNDTRSVGAYLSSGCSHSQPTAS
jgi:hypothetical protein